ncbi:MAG: carboxyltransferase domain-containing protein, partial [Vicinamibacteria bacterium]
VAIAGPQTGIYPRSLPGGWNLLGKTSLSLFNPSPPIAAVAGPSLLTPGDRVRFIPATTLDPIDPKPGWRNEGDGVEVLEAGLLTTVQDGGRHELRRVAVPWTGFADAASARVANLCVGNTDHAAAIEICGPGLKLRFLKSTFVALAGANVSAQLERADLEGNAVAIPGRVAVRVRPSNVLTVTGLDAGTRGYLAIAGLHPPELLGSASVDLGSGFLRPLASGDRLDIGVFDSDRARREPLAPVRQRESVRVILGPQTHHFDAAGIASFLDTSWQVGLDSDRVGARLDGARVAHSGAKEIISDGMVPGCVQIPPDGRPIVMLSDCPTTGGYPKIACVVSDDLGLVAQAIPGRTEIRFVSVSVDTL